MRGILLLINSPRGAKELVISYLLIIKFFSFDEASGSNYESPFVWEGDLSINFSKSSAHWSIFSLKQFAVAVMPLLIEFLTEFKPKSKTELTKGSKKETLFFQKNSSQISLLYHRFKFWLGLGRLHDLSDFLFFPKSLSSAFWCF